jgi:hypothetical protein
VQDEYSRGFLTMLPGVPGYSATPAEFREMFAHHLAAPSPACAPVLGQPIHCSRASGDGRIDPRGYNVLASTTTGGIVAKMRHDPVLTTLAVAAREAGVFARAEDRGFFGLVVPPGSRHLVANMMRPDGLLQIPGQSMALLEVKTMTPCATWYGSNWTWDGVARRATAVHREYLSHARATDRKLGLAVPAPAGGRSGPNAVVGPVEARLQSIAPVRALVFGGFGEASQDVHQLVGALAEAGAARLGVQLRVPRDQARARLRQILVQRLGFVSCLGIAQQRLQRLMFAAPAVAQREAGSRAGGPHARVITRAAVERCTAAERFSGAWVHALDRARG